MKCLHKDTPLARHAATGKRNAGANETACRTERSDALRSGLLKKVRRRRQAALDTHSWSISFFVVLLVTISFAGVRRGVTRESIRAFLGNRTGILVFLVSGPGSMHFMPSGVASIHYIDFDDPALKVKVYGRDCAGTYHDSPQISRDGTRVAYGKISGNVYHGGSSEVYIGRLRENGVEEERRIASQPAWAPHWWVDSRGNEYLIWTSERCNNEKFWPPDRNWGETWCIQIEKGTLDTIGTPRRMLDFSMNAGRSGDGTYMGNAQPNLGIVQVKKDEVENIYVKTIFDGVRLCNGSVNPSPNPESPVRLIILMYGHKEHHFYGNTRNPIQKIPPPPGVSGLTGSRSVPWPEWSTDEDYYVHCLNGTYEHDWDATKNSIIIRRVSDVSKARCVVDTGVEPHLWIVSGSETKTAAPVSPCSVKWGSTPRNTSSWVAMPTSWLAALKTSTV